jgi:GNAT superfamily N-acetyltransferase
VKQYGKHARTPARSRAASIWPTSSRTGARLRTVAAVPRERFTGVLQFRTARAEDVGAIVQLVECAYRGESSRAGWTTEADLLDGQRTDPEQVAALILDPAARILLAISGGERVGTLLVQRQADAAHIGMFAVRPTLQGRGLGRALLGAAERVAREEFQALRAEMTVIEQRLDILAWYARCGYTPTGVVEPFPYGNPRFGLPRRPDLRFVVLAKPLLG